jgi:S-adenosyl methyltransferase
VETLDPSRPNIARVYDYWLGGKDNFAAARELAEKVCALNPQVSAEARVAYVDIDPVAVSHARELLASRPGAAADLTDPAAVLAIHRRRGTSGHAQFRLYRRIVRQLWRAGHGRMAGRMGHELSREDSNLHMAD